jgi:hypothetical protein
MPAEKPRLPTGHRQLVHHLIKGGLIQRDETGLGWVTASRSGSNFRNETVDRLRERGFQHERKRYHVVESDHRGKLMAALEPPKPKRQPKEKPAKQKRAKKALKSKG